FRKWMIILFWVVTILFSIVQSRIVHYSSLAWFPLTFLAALTIYRLELKQTDLKKWIPAMLLAIGILISVILISVPFVGMNISMLIPYVRDEFAKANMEAVVAWTGWESLPGIIFLGVILMGYVLLKKHQYNHAAWTLFGGSAIVVFITSIMIVPKIEQYSQRAAIDFFEEKKTEDCYMTPLGYKTYAHLFYGEKVKPENPKSYDIEWLLHGDIDKPVYFVSKADRTERFSPYPELKELYRKNGFVFLKRELPE
ncbi:MAG: glycosyl transferase, partial [Saprospiraceae bacterium]